MAIAAFGATLITAGAAMKVYAAVQTIARAATIAWAAGQWLLNAALTANPIGLVVVGLAALAAGLTSPKKSETFRAIVTGAFEAVKGAFDAVKDAAGAVLDFFGDHWKTIATLISGPFAPIVLLATDAFGIRSALEDAITGIIDWIVGKATAIFDAGKKFGVGLKDGAVSGVTGIAAAVWNVVKLVGGELSDAVSTIAGWGKAVGTGVKNAAVSGVRGIASDVWDVIKTVGAFIAEGLDDRRLGREHRRQDQGRRGWRAPGARQRHRGRHQGCDQHRWARSSGSS